MVGDDARELPRLAQVQPQQRGERQEQRQAQAGQRVPVDVQAGATVGRAECLAADARTQALTDRRGHLVVEQHDRVIGTDHDVEHVQVAVDHTLGVNGLDYGLNLPVDAKSPFGVSGDRLRAGVGPDERVSLHLTLVQRFPLDELQHQELVLGEPELVEDPGHARHPGQPLEHPVLAPLPGHRVAARAVHSGVRASLLEHYALTGPLVAPDVETATVGEVQHLLDLVRAFRWDPPVPGRADRAARRTAVRRSLHSGHTAGRCPSADR